MSSVNGNNPLQDLDLINEVFNDITTANSQSSDNDPKDKKVKGLGGDASQVDEAQLALEDYQQQEIQQQQVNLQNTGLNNQKGNILSGLRRLSNGPNKI